jgi:hypothetical protein
MDGFELIELILELLEPVARQYDLFFVQSGLPAEMPNAAEGAAFTNPTRQIRVSPSDEPAGR